MVDKPPADGFVTALRKNHMQQKTSNSNKKIRVQKFPLGAPSITGHILNLQTIFLVLDDGGFLEGLEILDVTSLLELALEVLYCSTAF